ncbi:MAG: AAA family ATPase [Promethearchaeota archaeon]
MSILKQNSNYFIIISGPPASGKTTMGLKLASELKLPLITKDDFKELLFDSLGWKDREWSKKLGITGMRLLYHVLEANLKVNKPIIIETAFYREFETERLQKLKQRYAAESIQVYCYAEEDILRKRFLERVLNGDRHPGHGDYSVAKNEYNQIDIFDRYGVLEIGGPIIQIDTTDFENINYDLIFQKIKSLLPMT